ncbi:MAG: hypothetical protein ACE5I2_02430 [Anaerolineae bacterium]
MYYEGKFRDFMVGWLSLQLEEPGVDRDEIEALYEAVVYTEDDEMAFAAVERILGDWAARMLWGLSERWYDTTVEMARDLIEALRECVQEGLGDTTEFYLFFLNPFEDGCVPAGFGEMVEQQICWMFRAFYHTIGEMVLAPKGWEPYVVVEPSCEDASNIVVLAHPKEDFNSKVFVFQNWYGAWRLRFASLTELAEELLVLCQAIEQCATEAILHYNLAKTVTEVMSEV